MDSNLNRAKKGAWGDYHSVSTKHLKSKASQDLETMDATTDKQQSVSILPKPGTATPFKPPKSNPKVFSPLKKAPELPSIQHNVSSPLILPDPRSKTFYSPAQRSVMYQTGSGPFSLALTHGDFRFRESSVKKERTSITPQAIQENKYNNEFLESLSIKEKFLA